LLGLLNGLLIMFFALYLIGRSVRASSPKGANSIEQTHEDVSAVLKNERGTKRVGGVGFMAKIRRALTC
jgi:hypothetical protein